MQAEAVSRASSFLETQIDTTVLSQIFPFRWSPGLAPFIFDFVRFRLGFTNLDTFASLSVGSEAPAPPMGPSGSVSP